MTIAEAEQYLIALKHCETCESNDANDCKACEYHQKGSSAKCYDAIDIGIATMRKYQKIQEIVKQKDYDRFNSHNYYGYFLRVQDIGKVLQYGKID